MKFSKKEKEIIDRLKKNFKWFNERREGYRTDGMVVELDDLKIIIDILEK